MTVGWKRGFLAADRRRPNGALPDSVAGRRIPGRTIGRRRLQAESREFRGGTAPARRSSTVSGVAKRLAALAAIGGVLAVTAGPLLAQSRRPVCRAEQHECEKPATIAHCCCRDAAVPHEAATPAPARQELSGGASATPVLPKCLHTLPLVPHTPDEQTSPPRCWPLDLPTLFAALLI